MGGKLRTFRQFAAAAAVAAAIALIALFYLFSQLGGEYDKAAATAVVLMFASGTGGACMMAATTAWDEYKKSQASPTSWPTPPEHSEGDQQED